METNPSPDAVSESVIDVGLPQDLITEILLYVPVKSLGRFKCVSKPWGSLISSPEFIKSHFSLSLNDGHHFNHQLLFVSEAPNYGMKLCSLSATFASHNPTTNVVVVSDIQYPSPDQQGNLRIVGIINGLVCFSLGRNLCIWNPILKLSKHVPASGTIDSCNFVFHGFGYDELNDDYKVVQVVNVGHDGVNQSKVKVYSLRRDSWRVLEGFMDGVPYTTGTYVNGNIFWATNRAFVSGEKWNFFTVNMASDKYEQVQGPCYETCDCRCKIGSFGGSLSMLFRECDYSKVDLWVMDKNGVEESWSKVFSLPCDHDVHPDDDAELYYLQKVVCISGDGEILLEDLSGSLTVYRTKTKDFRNIQLEGLYGDFFVYVESLVAL